MHPETLMPTRARSLIVPSPSREGENRKALEPEAAGVACRRK